MHDSAARDVARVGPLDRAADVTRRPGRPRDVAVVWLTLGAAAAARARRPPDAARPRAARPARRDAPRRSRRRLRAPRPRRTGCRRSPTRRRPCGSRFRRCALRGAGGGGTTAAARNSTPMNVIRTPVAGDVLDRIGDELDEREGEHAGARAPGERRPRPVTTTASSAQAAARRAARARTPRRRSHDRLAAAQRGRRAGTRGRPSRRRRRPTRASSPRAGAATAAGSERLGRRRRRTPASARRAPSCSSAFHAPGLPSPVRYRSTPWRRATSSATGIEPQQVAHQAASDVLHACSPPSTSSATRRRPRRGAASRGWGSTGRCCARTPGLRFWRLLARAAGGR